MFLVKDVFHTIHSEVTYFAEVFKLIPPQDHFDIKIVLKINNIHCCESVIYAHFEGISGIPQSRQHFRYKLPFQGSK